MKTISLLCLLIIIASGNTFATSQSEILARIQKSFHEEFPDIENPVFFQDGDNYTAFFKKSTTFSERVYYNIDAEIIKVIKYYNGNELDPFIGEKVRKEYKDKTIFGVTEVLSDTDHFYQIILQGEKSWYSIISDTKGSMEIQKKWKGNL